MSYNDLNEERRQSANRQQDEDNRRARDQIQRNLDRINRKHLEVGRLTNAAINLGIPIDSLIEKTDNNVAQLQSSNKQLLDDVEEERANVFYSKAILVAEVERQLTVVNSSYLFKLQKIIVLDKIKNFLLTFNPESYEEVMKLQTEKSSWLIEFPDLSSDLATFSLRCLGLQRALIAKSQKFVHP